MNHSIILKNRAVQHSVNLIKLCFLLFLFSNPATGRAQKLTAGAVLLRQAQLKRIPWPQMSFTATITDSNKVKEPSVFRVFLNSPDALIAAVSPLAQKGHLLLLQNNELWLYFKGTAKPVKMTPIQRLAGSVSYIDIAGINWVDDYRTDSLRQDPANAGSTVLYLHAASAGASYKRIVLTIDKKSYRPLKADVYLQSDLLYKTILFSKYEMRDGKEINTRLEFIDHVNKNKRTVVDISVAKQELNLPARYFKKDEMPMVSAELAGNSH